MTLPPSQQHALNAIDDVLQSAEPRLATMFGFFTDLTRMEAMPAAETLPPDPWWARWARHRRPGHLAGARGPATSWPAGLEAAAGPENRLGGGLAASSAGSC